MTAKWVALAIVIGVCLVAFAGGMAVRAYHLPGSLLWLIAAVPAGAFAAWSWRRNAKRF